jgi:hypothetical protein
MINGVAYAAIFIIVALLIRRFAGHSAWRAFLVLSLFLAAGLYVVFTVRARESTLWIAGELEGSPSSAAWGWSACLAQRCGGL